MIEGRNVEQKKICFKRKNEKIQKKNGERKDEKGGER